MLLSKHFFKKYSIEYFSRINKLFLDFVMALNQTGFKKQFLKISHV